MLFIVVTILWEKFMFTRVLQQSYAVKCTLKHSYDSCHQYKCVFICPCRIQEVHLNLV